MTEHTDAQSNAVINQPSELSLGETIRADLAALAKLKGTELRGIGAWGDILTLPGAWAVILARVANAMNAKGIKPVSRLLYFLNIVLFSCDIQPGASIGPGLVLPHPTGICIGSGVTLGSNASLMGLARIGGGATDDPTLDGWPTIGDDVWMLDGSKILGAIKVGDRTVIAAATTVLHSFPEGDVILVGSPARVGKTRETDPS
jgi:serine O-acetyltransferase